MLYSLHILFVNLEAKWPYSAMRAQHPGPRPNGADRSAQEGRCPTIYREKISGVRADRLQLAKLMARLKAHDIVVVTKLDRLGRSIRELLDLIERIGGFV
jgi:DNA invertase Pin-like site-specific DNA recombinase